MREEYWIRGTLVVTDDNGFDYEVDLVAPQGWGLDGSTVTIDEDFQIKDFKVLNDDGDYTEGRPLTYRQLEKLVSLNINDTNWE